ncbi:hypothetical protein C8J57DRAFT_1070296 [Mycena rebaudengoi]|nr:hypothetical protein C8J57DRAFT_1070296 [Mycena rebaudengoi]
MIIRWNTTHAEIDCGTILEPASTRWITELARGLTGKKQKAALRKAKRLYLSPHDWDDLRRIAAVMAILHEVTLDLSKKDVPTICKILSTYKAVEEHLKASICPADDTCNLRAVIRAGLDKLAIHTEKALVSDYPLLGAILHPAIRLSYFEDATRWSSDLASRSKLILEHLYEICREESTDIETSSRQSTPSKPP